MVAFPDLGSRVLSASAGPGASVGAELPWRDAHCGEAAGFPSGRLGHLACTLHNLGPTFWLDGNASGDDDHGVPLSGCRKL